MVVVVYINVVVTATMPFFRYQETSILPLDTGQHALWPR